MLLLFPLRNFFSVDSDGIDLLNEPKSSDVYQENWENVVLYFPSFRRSIPFFLEKRKKKTTSISYQLKLCKFLSFGFRFLFIHHIVTLTLSALGNDKFFAVELLSVCWWITSLNFRIVFPNYEKERKGVAM